MSRRESNKINIINFLIYYNNDYYSNHYFDLFPHSKLKYIEANVILTNNSGKVITISSNSLYYVREDLIKCDEFEDLTVTVIGT